MGKVLPYFAEWVAFCKPENDFIHVFRKTTNPNKRNIVTGAWFRPLLPRVYLGEILGNPVMEI